MISVNSLNRESRRDKPRLLRGEPRRWRDERGSTLQVVLAIIGGIIALCVLVALVAVWAVQRYVHIEVDDSGGEKRVEISTPFGGITVEKAGDVARDLKLPVYPGARSDDDSASVRLWGEIGDERGALDITVAKFHTRDSLEQVDQFYRQQLGAEYKRQEGRISVRAFKHWKGHTRVEFDGVLFADESATRMRGVGLEPKSSGVEITLFDVREESEQ